ncbi:serine/threonine-protein kinase ULK3 isoform X2 [Planococcus citri]|uniref:serine/threonine-protein kinase ULK3 isoform X2 n=1 Tax=Planococcus citri TaxID=170843 RepID=UPI0031F83BA0
MTPLEDFINVTKIGYGSYSTVYKAQKKSKPKDIVAIKVVEKAKLSVRGRDDIVNEIRVMKLFKHPHILEMRQFEWDEKNIYIIMEYCDGGDLSTFIKQKCKLPESTCQKFLQQLAVGLQFLRSHDISHLDLKPQNLLLVTKPKLTLKIGDFGFAQFLSDTTQKHAIRGSPLYMAPEMLLGGQYDAKADLWSVGVITYECLFGKAPFSSSTYNELYARVKSKIPITIPENGVLSKNCQDFLKNLLVYDPKVRMSYETFFNHSFLDLEHVPSEANFKKAMKIISKAETCDKASQHIEAFNLYCEALSYLVPICRDETNEDKKIKLRSEVIRYTKRAEELKCMLHLSDETKADASSEKQSRSSRNVQQDSYDEVDSPVKHKEAEKVPKFSKIVARASSLKNLLDLCSKTPNLMTALEIGMNGQMYLAEGKYQLAYEKFESSLGILVPAIKSEPPGIRKELLYVQTREWLKQAESAKSLLSMKENEEQLSSTENRETCVIQ